MNNNDPYNIFSPKNENPQENNIVLNNQVNKELNNNNIENNNNNIENNISINNNYNNKTETKVNKYNKFSYILSISILIAVCILTIKTVLYGKKINKYEKAYIVEIEKKDEEKIKIQEGKEIKTKGLKSMAVSNLVKCLNSKTDINKIPDNVKKTIDEYYYDPSRDLLKPDKNNQLNHCLRLRAKDSNCFITYKDDVFENGKWLYSNEYETEIESIEVVKSIFHKLGLKKLLEIDNEKETFKFEDYEIVIENVKNLGVFMEVEYCTNDDVNVKEIKKHIQSFIDSLEINFSKELNMGKPEMFIRKNNVTID